MSINKKGALCLTFDNMGSATEVGLGNRTDQLADDPSLHIGYPRVLRLLDKLDLKATFFIEGWNALHNPELVREIAGRGHEIGLHGWVHEVFHQLTPFDAERLLRDAQAAFRSIGIEPKGFRAPGGKRGEDLLNILRKLGLSYDSSVDEHAEATEPSMVDGDIPNIPWQWSMIDYYQYHMHPDGSQTPTQLEAVFSKALDAAAEKGSLVTFIFHVVVSGVDTECFEVMSRLLESAATSERLEVLTAGEIAIRTDDRPRA